MTVWYNNNNINNTNNKNNNNAISSGNHQLPLITTTPLHQLLSNNHNLERDLLASIPPDSWNLTYHRNPTTYRNLLEPSRQIDSMDPDLNSFPIMARQPGVVMGASGGHDMQYHLQAGSALYSTPDFGLEFFRKNFQSKQWPGGISPGGEVGEQCRVCGDFASGTHFGVLTCEGCKGFFKRNHKDQASKTGGVAGAGSKDTLQGSILHCSRNGNCDINTNNRNSCRACRYQKCLNAGMSREAIKLGRRSKKQRVTLRKDLEKRSRAAQLINQPHPLVHHLPSSNGSINGNTLSTSALKYPLNVTYPSYNLPSLHTDMYLGMAASLPCPPPTVNYSPPQTISVNPVNPTQTHLGVLPSTEHVSASTFPYDFYVPNMKQDEQPAIANELKQIKPDFSDLVASGTSGSPQINEAFHQAHETKTRWGLNQIDETSANLFPRHGFFSQRPQENSPVTSVTHSGALNGFFPSGRGGDDIGQCDSYSQLRSESEAVIFPTQYYDHVTASSCVIPPGNGNEEKLDISVTQ